jgi:hypothetical protein
MASPNGLSKESILSMSSIDEFNSWFSPRFPFDEIFSHNVVSHCCALTNIDGDLFNIKIGSGFEPKSLHDFLILNLFIANSKSIILGRKSLEEEGGDGLFVHPMFNFLLSASFYDPLHQPAVKNPHHSTLDIFTHGLSIDPKWKVFQATDMASRVPVIHLPQESFDFLHTSFQEASVKVPRCVTYEHQLPATPMVGGVPPPYDQPPLDDALLSLPNVIRRIQSLSEPASETSGSISVFCGPNATRRVYRDKFNTVKDPEKYRKVDEALVFPIKFLVLSTYHGPIHQNAIGDKLFGLSELESVGTCISSAHAKGEEEGSYWTFQVLQFHHEQ